MIFGLPNIAGYLNAANVGNVNSDFNVGWNGALKVNRLRSGLLISTIADSRYKIGDDANLDASQSNSIFGSSDTVQPAGMYVQMLIRYAA